MFQLHFHTYRFIHGPTTTKELVAVCVVEPSLVLPGIPDCSVHWATRSTCQTCIYVQFLFCWWWLPHLGQWWLSAPISFRLSVFVVWSISCSLVVVGPCTSIPPQCNGRIRLSTDDHLLIITAAAAFRNTHTHTHTPTNSAAQLLLQVCKNKHTETIGL